MFFYTAVLFLLNYNTENEPLLLKIKMRISECAPGFSS